VPVLDMPLEETFCSCPSDVLQRRSKEVSLGAEVRSHVSLVPDEARLVCVNMFGLRDKIFCFQSGFRRIRYLTGLIAASALTLLRRPDQALSSTLQSSL